MEVYAFLIRDLDIVARINWPWSESIVEIVTGMRDLNTGSYLHEITPKISPALSSEAYLAPCL